MDPRESERILVVDDDEALRNRLVRAFRDRGYDAGAAADTREALEQAQRCVPDLAVIDLRMPGGSGLDLVGDLNARYPELRMIVLTGYGSIATAVEAVRRGAVDYLTKPADADQILSALEDPRERSEVGAHAVPSLDRVEWEHIQRVLNDCDGNVSRAARALGVHRRTLQRKLAILPPRR